MHQGETYNIFRTHARAPCTGWFITYVYRTAWRGLMRRGVAWYGVARCRHGSCQTAVQGFLPALAFTIIARYDSNRSETKRTRRRYPHSRGGSMVDRRLFRRAEPAREELLRRSFSSSKSSLLRHHLAVAFRLWSSLRFLTSLNFITLLFLPL